MAKFFVIREYDGLESVDVDIAAAKADILDRFRADAALDRDWIEAECALVEEAETSFYNSANDA